MRLRKLKSSARCLRPLAVDMLGKLKGSRVLSSSFARDVAKLVIGTVFGRGIILLSLPIVTRLYTPEDFTILAIYLGIITTIAVASCMRLEIAIPLADNDDDAANLLGLSLISVVTVAAVVAGVVLFASEPVANLLGKPEIQPHLWLVPVGVFMAGSYSAFQYWATRAKRFSSIAKTRVTQSFVGVSTMIGLGLLKFSPIGLLLGHTLTAGAGNVQLGRQAFVTDVKILRAVSWSGLKASLRKYKNYPLFSAPEALANIAGIQVPVILIAAMAQDEAGFLLLATQVMSAPMALLGASISQVYVSRAQEERSQGRLASFTLGITKRLFMIGLPPLMITGLLAPRAFPYLFGSEWERAGVIVAVIVPWMALRFIASPISMVMFVVGQQRSMLMLTVFGAVFRIGLLVVVATQSSQNAVLAYAVASAGFYVVCLSTFLKAAGAKKEKYKLFAWIALALSAYVGLLFTPFVFVGP